MNTNSTPVQNGFASSNASPIHCDDLMRKAYATLTQSTTSCTTPLHQCWESVVHSGNHYIIPGGPTGRRYVDLLTEEVQHLAVGNFPSERVLVFSSVMLQRDRMVCKGADIRRLLDRLIGQWCDGHFDLLVQEADCCKRGLKHSNQARRILSGSFLD